jgi:hypothetical protein
MDVTIRMGQQRYTLRRREEVARFLAGMDVVEPGLVRAEEWRPGPGAGAAGRSTGWGAVARKR